MINREPVKCDCGHMSEPTKFTPGYGIDGDTGKTHCYSCCAEIKRQFMIDNGKTVLYLVERDNEHFVSDWAGKLEFKIPFYATGKHNIAGVRYDVWFRGPDKAIWHGVTYGDNTQLCHCKRTKHESFNTI